MYSAAANAIEVAPMANKCQSATYANNTVFFCFCFVLFFFQNKAFIYTMVMNTDAVLYIYIKEWTMKLKGKGKYQSVWD